MLESVLTILPVLVIVILTAGILAAIEVGYRTGLRRRARKPDLIRGESKAIETAIFGLMGL